MTGREGPDGVQRYSSTISLTSALDGGGWFKPRPGNCTPGRESRNPLYVQEAGLASEPIWTAKETLAFTGV